MQCIIQINTNVGNVYNIPRFCFSSSFSWWILKLTITDSLPGRLRQKTQFNNIKGFNFLWSWAQLCSTQTVMVKVRQTLHKQSQTIQSSEEVCLREHMVTSKMDATVYRKEASTILNYKGNSDRPRSGFFASPARKKKVNC